MTFHDRIVRDPAICAGQPVIRGTRVLVRVILGYLAHGEPTEVILREFPSLTEDDVLAVIAFAAAAAGEDLPAPSSVPLEGGILAALRRSPIVGADVIPERPFEPGRKVDLYAVAREVAEDPSDSRTPMAEATAGIPS